MIIPLTFMVCIVFLLIVPLYAAPYDTGMGLAIVCSGIPVYLVGVVWTSKPEVFQRYVSKYIPWDAFCVLEIRFECSSLAL